MTFLYHKISPCLVLPCDMLPCDILFNYILPCDALPCDNTMYFVLESSKYVFYITFVLCILVKGKYCLAIPCKILPCDIEKLSPLG